MGFIKLTHKGTGKGIYLNSSSIDSIDTDVDGCFVRCGSLVVKVEENHNEVIKIISSEPNQKIGEVKSGNKKNV
jgi:hypothetical protein